ncbi:MAG: metallophosphoesterase N-terminal domain-containing protein, partial [Pseudobacter sp.]|uniref:metallophosphoesterase N-terminal domain-containing protein n=1 Tax=Pseudobacter sp. TaxID=2045420 RepID=UPI003F80BB26
MYKIPNSIYCLLVLVLINAMPAMAQQKITGRVRCEGKGVKDVVVSCGTATVRTDARGHYTLYPDAGQQFVQLSVPAGYLTRRDTTIPRFYQPLKSNRSAYDFNLIRNPVNDDQHVFFAQADVQVTSREELATYRNDVVSDMQS